MTKDWSSGAVHADEHPEVMGMTREQAMVYERITLGTQTIYKALHYVENDIKARIVANEILRRTEL